MAPPANMFVLELLTLNVSSLSTNDKNQLLRRLRLEKTQVTDMIDRINAQQNSTIRNISSKKRPYEHISDSRITKRATLSEEVRQKIAPHSWSNPLTLPRRREIIRKFKEAVVFAGDVSKRNLLRDFGLPTGGGTVDFHLNGLDDVCLERLNRFAKNQNPKKAEENASAPRVKKSEIVINVVSDDEEEDHGRDVAVPERYAKVANDDETVHKGDGAICDEKREVYEEHKPDTDGHKADDAISDEEVEVYEEYVVEEEEVDENDETGHSTDGNEADDPVYGRKSSRRSSASGSSSPSSSSTSTSTSTSSSSSSS